MLVGVAGGHGRSVGDGIAWLVDDMVGCGSMVCAPAGVAASAIITTSQIIRHQIAIFIFLDIKKHPPFVEDVTNTLYFRTAIRDTTRFG